MAALATQTRVMEVSTTFVFQIESSKKKAKWHRKSKAHIERRASRRVLIVPTRVGNNIYRPCDFLVLLANEVA